VAKVPLDGKDHAFLDKVVSDFCTYFGGSKDEILKAGFIKLMPLSTRPYKKIYAY
jgi:hypothetical protein